MSEAGRKSNVESHRKNALRNNKTRAKNGKQHAEDRHLEQVKDIAATYKHYNNYTKIPKTGKFKNDSIATICEIVDTDMNF